MIQISRLWCAFAAIGAGTIHLAVGASAPVLLSVILVGLGVAELGWGVATLVRGRYPMPNQALVGALLPLVVWAAAAGLRSTSAVPADVTVLPVFPMTVATLFSLFVAGSLALTRRGAGRREGVSAAAVEPAPQSWRFLAALTLGGVLVSGLTTPALAATDAGTQAVPHGSHSDSGPAVLPEEPQSHH
ncbi:hypothetical protein E3T23_11485 [Cryobacterium cheniae]|uniref:Uncharacterized protein n=1 Tax=Cryobacterium cheniae TaxID=1259262 RepID=A0A4R8XKT6_9MICO|nr:hypothetical protein [Cryobacterium cheniae]TFC78682.1 hypothetical protein E3T23_11485 [Cryobacterium cheniae]